MVPVPLHSGSALRNIDWGTPVWDHLQTWQACTLSPRMVITERLLWDITSSEPPGKALAMNHPSLNHHLTVAFLYLKGTYKKDGGRPFSRACCNQVRGHGFRLKVGSLRLDIRKKVFTKWVVRHRKRFPREVVAVSSLNCQGGWGLKQPDLVKAVPVHGRGIGLHDL